MTATSAIATEHEGLLDIDEVRPFSDEDKQCFAELREVLERHGALQRFGVTLLHNHFPVYEGEVLVEECDEEGRTLTLKPMKRGEVDEGTLMQTNWRLDTEASVQGCVAYCLMDAGRHVGPKHAAT
jgi:hypothetical protein